MTPFPDPATFHFDRGSIVFRSILPCSLLAGLAVVGRFASRRIKKVPLGPADWTIAAGLVLAWTVSALAAFIIAGTSVDREETIKVYEHQSTVH